MEPLKVLFKKLRQDATVPRYQTSGASGFDLHAALDGPRTLVPKQRDLVPTGLAMAIPKGYEGQVRPRSGLALNLGVGVLNSPGTVDADYRGEVKVLVINHGQENVVIQPGDRIAQMVITPVNQVELEEAEDLDQTDRGAGGFGSTGVQGTE